MDTDSNSSSSTKESEVEEIEGADGNSATAPNEAMEAVMNNSLIFSEIVGHLDFLDLKQCRLVSKLWDEQILIKLRRRAAVLFCLCPSHISGFGSLENWALTFAEQTEFLKKLKMENVSLNLYEHCKIRQVTKEVCWLMDNFGDRFKCLFLGLCLSDARDAAVFFNILNRLSSLKEIELNLSFNMDLKKIKLPAPLETVKILTIRNITQDESASRDPSLILNLYKVFPNVEKIKLKARSFTTLFKFNSPNDAGFQTFRHLKTLEVYLTDNDSYDSDESFINFLQRLELPQQRGLENFTDDSNGFMFLGSIRVYFFEQQRT